MTRLERLRCEIVALADSLVATEKCSDCDGTGMTGCGHLECPTCNATGHAPAIHPLAAPLRGIAWSLLPREERYREPESGGGPLLELTCDHCNATGKRGGADCDRCGGSGGWSTEAYKAADELTRLSKLAETDVLSVQLLLYAAVARAAVVQARPGETLDDVLRREGLEIAEETCATCDGEGAAPKYRGDNTSGYIDHETCTECHNGRVVAEDAIEVRCAGQTRFARRVT